MTNDAQDLQHVRARLDALADPTLPAYVHDVLAVTARTRQRPAWTFPARWFPLEAARVRPGTPLARRPIVIVALLAAAAALAVLGFAGSRPRLPAPFGPAANGVIAVARDGDLFAVDGLTGSPRLLVGGPDNDGSPSFSPDGTRLLFVRTVRVNPHLMVADADGRNVVQLTPRPLIKPSAVAWAPDGRSVAVASFVGGSPRVSILPIDGTPPLVVDLGGIVDSLAWRPPDGDELLVRGADADGRQELYLVDAHSGGVTALGLARPDQQTGPGPYVARLRLAAPTWSPDGAMIAFEQIDAVPVTPSRLGWDVVTRIHVAAANGTGEHPIDAASAGIAQVAPDWSPDGRSILFRRERPLPNSHEAWWAVRRADGSDPTIDLGTPVTGLAGAAAWSPDGTLVLIHDERRGEVRVVDPATGETVAVFPSTDTPAWQRVAP